MDLLSTTTELIQFNLDLYDFSSNDDVVVVDQWSDQTAPLIHFSNALMVSKCLQSYYITLVWSLLFTTKRWLTIHLDKRNCLSYFQAAIKDLIGSPTHIINDLGLQLDSTPSHTINLTP